MPNGVDNRTLRVVKDLTSRETIQRRFEVLANHKSAIKKIARDEKARLRNKSIRTRYRNLIRAVRAACETGDKEKAGEALKAAVPYLQRAAHKGVIHANTASRNISRLTRQVQGIA